MIATSKLWRTLGISSIIWLVAQGTPAAGADTSDACTQQQFEGTAFIVCVADARRHEVRLAWRDSTGKALRGFARLKNSLGKKTTPVLFAMNAGMYDDTGAPVGLYVEQSMVLHALNLADGPGNFHLKPNGVFSVDTDGHFQITTSDAYHARKVTPAWATQSGPMLVINGTLHPSFSHDGDSRFIRNGVGVAESDMAYFVISTKAVSFGRMARFFRDVLKCNNALYLDGAVSGLWHPATKRMDHAHPLGPMIVVRARP